MDFISEPEFLGLRANAKHAIKNKFSVEHFLKCDLISWQVTLVMSTLHVWCLIQNDLNRLNKINPNHIAFFSGESPLENPTNRWQNNTLDAIQSNVSGPLDGSCHLLIVGIVELLQNKVTW